MESQIGRLFNNGFLLEYGAKRWIGKSAEMPAEQFGRVHARKERSLACRALGQSFDTECRIRFERNSRRIARKKRPVLPINAQVTQRGIRAGIDARIARSDAQTVYKKKKDMKVARHPINLKAIYLERILCVA
jgi:hypothetical protein